jgi:RHS repeat-associated protein
MTLDYGGANLQTFTHYDGAGNVIWQRDTFGRWTKNEYDALNRPVTTTLNYENGDPLSIAGPNLSWASAVDNDTDLKSVTRYDAFGRVEQVIDNYVTGVFTATKPITDHVTLYQYDTLNRVTTTTSNYAPGLSGTELNRVSTTAYNATTGRVDGTRDTLNRWVSQQYDAIGQVIKTYQNCTGGGAPQSCGSQTTDQNVLTQFGYDRLGRTVVVTDALGFATRTFYDGVGRTSKTIRNYKNAGVFNPNAPAENVSTTYGYDALGQTLVVTDVLNAATRSTYDALGRTTSAIDPMGRVTQMGYDGTGTLRWSKQPNGQLTVYHVDGLGRVTATIVNYANGQPDAADPVDQDLITRTIYDEGGRRVQQIQRADPAEQVTAFAYDKLDRLIKVTEHAVAGACTKQPCNVETRYRYDRSGNRTAIIDANNHVRRFAYDAADQQISATDALTRTTEWSYDAGGRVANQLDPRRATATPQNAYDLTFTYNGLDRLTQTSAGASANLATITATYDQLGRRRTLADSSGNTSFTPDALGRTTQVVITPTAQLAQTIGYGYNGRGERTSLSYPNSGPTLQYGYWPDGQLRVVTDTTTLTSYTPDPFGRLAQVARANGAVTHYGYDRSNRLLHSTTMVSGTLIGHFQYDVDRQGLRTVVAETLPMSPTISTTRFETNSFETANLLDPVSGVDQVAGTVEIETAAPIKGAYSARVPNTSDSYLREDIANTDDLFVSFYLRVTALPSSNTRVLQIRNGSTTVGAMQLTTSGRLRLRNDSTNIGLDSAPLTVGAVYRVGVHQKKGTGANGVLAAYLAAGDASFTSPFAASTTQSFTTQATRVSLGASTGTAANIVVDNFTLDRNAAAPIGLSAALQTARSSDTADSPRLVADASALAAPESPAFPPASSDPTRAAATLNRMPLTFVPNTGQTDALARFVMRGMGGTLFFTPGELVMALRTPTRQDGQVDPRSPGRPRPRPTLATVVRLRYVGASPTATLAGTLSLPGRTNYLLGNNRSHWRTNLPTYAGLVYQRLYPGIDLHYTGTDGQLKGTYIVAAGADPSRIRWSYAGAQDVRVDRDGNLVITLPAPPSPISSTETLTSTLIERAPIAWQTINEREVAVPVSYVVEPDGSVRFALGAYNPSRPLTIDPTLIYSTYLGGSGQDVGAAVVVDAQGNTYITGSTSAANFPTTSTQIGVGGSIDVFVAKLSPSGSAFLYTTYLGGSADDEGDDLVVNNQGMVTLSVATSSTNFPTQSPNQASNGGGEHDTVVARLNTAGNGLVYSTYLGGSGAERGWGLAQDGDGAVYVAGRTDSPNFPTTTGAYDEDCGSDGTCDFDGEATNTDAFVTKLEWNGSALSYGYSTFIGDSGEENAFDIALDSQKNAYITGIAGNVFPTTTGAWQTTPIGDSDAFVSKLNADGDDLLYSTYLGGTRGDVGSGIRVNAAYEAFVVGGTSSADMTTTVGAYDEDCGSDGTCDFDGSVYESDGFVTKLNAAGSGLVYSTYLGGGSGDDAYAIVVDDAGNAYVSGQTSSTDFPVLLAAQGVYGGGLSDRFVTALQPAGDALIYSTYLGGSGLEIGSGLTIDPQGNAYVSGTTSSANFPLAYPVQKDYQGGGQDAFVAKLNAPERIIRYTYDGLQRLIRAETTPGVTYDYSYDDAGNRTGVWVNGTRTITHTHDATDQVSGWSYDLAGNLLNDGSATYVYDALNRTTSVTATGQTRTNTYNGDGALIKQVANGTTTYYTQDLVAPLSQVLQTKQGATSISELYGLERLASKTGTTRTWYLSDALGSVRRTTTEAGVVNLPIFYDPWGTVESGSVPTFGFTGEQHDTALGMVNLRARWYHTAKGTFTAHRWRTNESWDTIPYSHHPYAYALGNPVLFTDRSGRYATYGDEGGGSSSTIRCATIQDDEAAFRCVYGRPFGGAGPADDQQEQGDNSNYECIGNPGAIEVRLPLAGGGEAPVCLKAPRTQFDPTYFNSLRKPKQPVFIVGPLGNLVCLDDGSDSQQQEEPQQLEQSSFLPDLGIPAPLKWLKKLTEDAEGFLKPKRLFRAVDENDAERIVGDFIGLRKNTTRYRSSKPNLPYTSRSAPDFVSRKELVAEVKWKDSFVQRAGQLQVQLDIAEDWGVPYYLFVREGTDVPKSLKVLIEATGGKVIKFFR